jgi:hypothetical protein
LTDQRAPSDNLFDMVRAPLDGRPLGRNQLTDRPQEGGELAGNRRCRNRGLFAIRNEPTAAGAQPNLCLPGDAADTDGEILEPIAQGLADPCRKSVSPRSLDQDASVLDDCRSS